jgi:hypothetical protein
VPWARVPPDKLINLPLFGIDVIADDGDFVWMRGPSGRMRIHKLMPRVFFESMSDAHQAGATAIMISNEAEQEEHDALKAQLSAKGDESSGPEAEA